MGFAPLGITYYCCLVCLRAACRGHDGTAFPTMHWFLGALYSRCYGHRE